jgi:predicted amidohydrolase
MRIIALSEQEHVDTLGQTLERCGADLAILPERWSGGGGWTEGEPSDGIFARTLAGIARQARCAIIAPYLEQEKERRYASVLVIDGLGLGLCGYRKTHLSMREQADGLSRGNWLSIVPVEGERIGLLLGEDILHPETARCLALEGASLLVAASTVEPGLLTALARVRAVENGLPFVAVSGGSAGQVIAADPEGRVLVDAPAPATFDLAEVQTDPSHRHAARRRAELYRAIVEPPPRS